MGTLSPEQKKFLEKFENRVSMEKNERILYGHDIAAIPAQIRPLAGKTIPDAIVQPQTEEELVEIVQWAYSHNIPVTPRGKASSGSGGVIPLKKRTGHRFLSHAQNYNNR